LRNKNYLKGINKILNVNGLLKNIIRNSIFLIKKMISPLGLLDGITSLLILTSALIFGTISIYHSIKYKAKLLGVAGLAMIFGGCLWLGPSVDFFLVVFTGKNLNPIELYGIISFVWVGPALVCVYYLGGELIAPKKKWYIFGFYSILAIVFEIFLFLDTSSVLIFTLDKPGEDLIDARFVRGTPMYYITIFVFISHVFVLALGFAIKAYQSADKLRKKFCLLTLGFSIFIIGGTLDTLIPVGIAIGIIRGVTMTFPLWIYLGLKW
jgi:hypothetical protein